MFLLVATSLRNVQFAFLSQGVLSLRNQFNVVFNRKVSDGWLYFRNSYEKGSACLLTVLQMSNDPSTREVSSAAQGIKIAQIVTGISEN